MKMKILLFGALPLWFMEPVYTFWWWFSSEIVENENFSREDSSIQTVKSVFAPFEISIVEQKFLQEANTYLSNLPMLDQCNLLVSLIFCFFFCYWVMYKPEYSQNKFWHKPVLGKRESRRLFTRQRLLEDPKGSGNFVSFYVLFRLLVVNVLYLQG